MFQGSYVALVTPLKDGQVDYETLECLVEFHVQNGTSGLVPCGTTGESPTLSHQEHKDVVEFVVRKAEGRLPVIAGTGSNSTAEAVELTAAAARAGAQATLQVSPYYNKPEPDGMFNHFKAVGDEAGLPIVLYSIPSRTGREIAMETVVRLADEVEQVVAIKEAGGSLDRVSEIRNRTSLDILSGDDSLTLPMMAVGANGVISVVANLVPGDVAAMADAMLKDDIVRAREMHLKMFPLVKAMFCETNPIPVKSAMAMLGLCREELRPPLSAPRAESRARIRRALEAYGLSLVSD